MFSPPVQSSSKLNNTSSLRIQNNYINSWNKRNYAQEGQGYYHNTCTHDFLDIDPSVPIYYCICSMNFLILVLGQLFGWSLVNDYKCCIPSLNTHIISVYSTTQHIIQVQQPNNKIVKKMKCQRHRGQYVSLLYMRFKEETIRYLRQCLLQAVNEATKPFKMHLTTRKTWKFLPFYRKIYARSICFWCSGSNLW